LIYLKLLSGETISIYRFGSKKLRWIVLYIYSSDCCCCCFFVCIC